MKKILAGLIFLLIFGQSLWAKQQAGYTIEGHLEGLSDGTVVSMDLLDEEIDDFKTTDSAVVKNRQFVITGIVPDGPRFYYLKFNTSGKVIRLFIDNGEHISIHSADINKISHGYLEEWVDIAGSPTNHSWTVLTTLDITYRNSLRSLDNYISKVKDSAGFTPSLIQTVVDLKKDINKYFYYEVFKDSGPWRKKARFLELSDTWFRESNHDAVFGNLYNDMDSSERNSYYGKIVWGLRKLCVGQSFPSFSLPDPDGKMLSSNTIIGKSKLTLIQFWHTGITGLKENQETLKNYFQKYHTKGLSIVGISSDTDTLEWKIRVQAARFPWNNVSDLMGSRGIEETVYHEGRPRVGWRPVNVLVDADGKIVAWDVEGIELQWYLWKYFDNDSK
jgi:peroxiredoxin